MPGLLRGDGGVLAQADRSGVLWQADRLRQRVVAISLAAEAGALAAAARVVGALIASIAVRKRSCRSTGALFVAHPRRSEVSAHDDELFEPRSPMLAA